MDHGLIDILACPICKGPLLHRREQQELVCRGDRLAWPIRDGVPLLRVSDAREISQPELLQMERR
ncbi:Trm112 family protein [Thioalkalivibrio sp. XN8]|uniref:Trm112 family protein n=1 Tax=Thioalkalivibrio sp. XN8 TaxID=2712863 RepID=UPI0013EBC4B0|nr:Trm112 family protein [Thioalkalivibrio sp. XN8]NGP53843.1 Trm112 family protein [Thioalkalivibrio sp. XN8]